MKALVAPEDQSAAAQRIREETRRYVLSRTALLREMLTAHLEAPNTQNTAEALSRLEELGTEFGAAVNEYADDYPGITQLPAVLSRTALPLPEFARGLVPLNEAAPTPTKGT